MTVEHSVERMKQLMMQLREGTTPVNAPHGVDLGRRHRAHPARQGEPAAGARDPARGEGRVAQGHEDRLERVIGHLVQNAIDATDKDGQRVDQARDARTGRRWSRSATPATA